LEQAVALARALAALGGPRLAGLEWHEEIASTSDRLKHLARAGAAAWTAVVAERQTAGRGREGRRWVSPQGGLYLSVLLRPDQPRGVPLLPLLAGVALGEVLDGVGVACELKWPNDVLVRGRKLAGILTEASSGGSGVEWVVLGIGVNVALDPQALPEALRETATSLVAEGASGASTPELAAATLARLATWLERLPSQPTRIVAAWRERAVAWWGAEVEVRTRDGERHGRLVGVDEDGALVLDAPGGGRIRLLSGEVTRLRPAAAAGSEP
jgi:BirA family biotin operon repressor/biotin-[acetyl-CoA-carboxylase] ligase